MNKPIEKPKNHLWDAKPNRNRPYSICKRCGTVRQRHYYELPQYFVDYQKDPLFTSPNCYDVQQKNKEKDAGKIQST